jgi:hypothetical protein
LPELLQRRFYEVAPMFRLLAYTSTFSILIPFTAILVAKAWKVKREGIDYLIYFIYMSLLFEVLFFALSRFGIPNVQYSHPYAIAEFLLLTMFFKGLFNWKSKIIRYYIWGFLFYLIVNPFLIEPFSGFNPLARSIICLIFIAVSLFYYYQLYRDESIVEPEKSPSFWFVTGLFVYFAASIFTFIFINQLFVPNQFGETTIRTSLFFHSLSNILKNLLLAVGLWLTRKHQEAY